MIQDIVLVIKQIALLLKIRGLTDMYQNKKKCKMQCHKQKIKVHVSCCYKCPSVLINLPLG